MQNKHPSLVGAARRDLGRLKTVSATIVRHGFGELLLKTPLLKTVGIPVGGLLAALYLLSKPGGERKDEG